MKDKYVVLNIPYDEIYFVEATSSQVEAMKWLADKLDYGTICFFNIDSEQKFEEI